MSNRILLLNADGQAGDSVIAALQQTGMDVTVAHDLGTALHQLSDRQLLILDAGDESTLAMLCRRINDATGSQHPPILAIANSADVESRVRLLEAGADDVISQPIDQQELQALADALMIRAPVRHGTRLSSAGTTPRPAQTQPGRVIAFAAAKGGSGTTALAVNTALLLAEMAPGSVAIADMDMYHGQVSSHLDIYARSSTAEMARDEASMQTPDAVHESGKPHSSGLTVFGAPYRPDDALDLSADHLAALVDALRTAYGTVIIDAGSTLDARSRTVISKADRLVMPVTPDIPSLRLLHAALDMMSETGSVTDHTLFVLNNIYPRPTISSEQIEEHLGVHISLEIPYGGEEFLRSVNEGQPLVAIARRSPSAVAIKQLAELIAETRLEEAMVQPARRGRLRGFLGRA